MTALLAVLLLTISTSEPISELPICDRGGGGGVNSSGDRLRAISILIQRAPPLPPFNVPSPTLSSLTLESRLDPFGERISLAVSTQSFFEEEEVKLERGAAPGCCERPSVFPRGRHELRGSGIIAPQCVVDIIQGLSTALLSVVVLGFVHPASDCF